MEALEATTATETARPATGTTDSPMKHMAYIQVPKDHLPGLRVSLWPCHSSRVINGVDSGVERGHGALEPLIASVAAFSATDQGAVGAMVDSLIAPIHAPSRGQHRRSMLNNDGLPLQVCLSSSTEKVSVRLIGDPCTGVADTVERLRQSIRRLHDVICWTKSQGLARYYALTVERTLPTDRRQRGNLQYGGLWLAMGVRQGEGMALYTTLDWAEVSLRARWRYAQEWLESILPAGSRAAEQLGVLPLLAWPVSVGLEGSSDADAVAKVYARLKEPVSLGNLGLDSFPLPEFAGFSERILAGRTLPDTGMLISVGFAVASGQLISTKLDICGHCVPRSPKEWQDTILQIARELDVRPILVDRLLTEQPVEVAFIGLGQNVPSSYRVNLYLKAISLR